MSNKKEDGIDLGNLETESRKEDHQNTENQKMEEISLKKDQKPWMTIWTKLKEILEKAPWKKTGETEKKPEKPENAEKPEKPEPLQKEKKIPVKPEMPEKEKKVPVKPEIPEKEEGPALDLPLDAFPETPEDRAAKIRRIRRKRELMRRRRRKAMILRGVLAVAALAIVIGVGVGITALVKKQIRKVKQKEVQETAAEEQLVAVKMEDVVHLSFPMLIADPQAAFGQEDTNAASHMDQSYLTVDEFEKILDQLYQEGYVLVHMEDLAAVEDGKMVEKELYLPKGKKPLLLSQQNLNYELLLAGQGLADRLVLDESGKVVNELTQADGTVVTGAYDVVPCVDAFVQKHPDFSYEGARGILGLTGYNGILGYRTDKDLANSENNRYASRFGVFDTEAEKKAAEPVIKALKKEGWEFACNGYDLISYQGNLKAMKADLKLWKERVGALTGETTILMYPFGTDISGHAPYQEKDELYQFLSGQGFQYFCAMDLSGSWNQCSGKYFRCNYQNLDGYRMYRELYQGSRHFAGLLDFTEVYDAQRPSASEHTGEDTQDVEDPENTESTEGTTE